MNSNKFIICGKYKGLPKKHVDVCRECKWQKTCKPFQLYLQPELPFQFLSEKPPG